MPDTARRHAGCGDRVAVRRAAWRGFVSSLGSPVRPESFTKTILCHFHNQGKYKKNSSRVGRREFSEAGRRQAWGLRGPRTRPRPGAPPGQLPGPPPAPASSAHPPPVCQQYAISTETQASLLRPRAPGRPGEHTRGRGVEENRAQATAEASAGRAGQSGQRVTEGASGAGQTGRRRVGEGERPRPLSSETRRCPSCSKPELAWPGAQHVSSGQHGPLAAGGSRACEAPSLSGAQALPSEEVTWLGGEDSVGGRALAGTWAVDRSPRPCTESHVLKEIRSVPTQVMIKRDF